MYRDLRGVIWYSYFKKGEGYNKYLTLDFPRDSLNGKLVVQFINKKGGYLFSVFNTYTEFFKYMNTLPIEHRTFFETILGEFPQKPKFDLDIKPIYKEETSSNEEVLTKEETSSNEEVLTKEGVLTKPEDTIETEGEEILSISRETIINEQHLIDHEKIMNNLVISILKVFNEYEIPFDLARDVLIYSSHSKEGSKEIKRSYHVVIDNYYHDDCLEAQAFCRLVMEKMLPEYRQYVDESVYKSLQQFRLYGNQKRESGRVKIFHDKWYLNGNEITYEYPKFNSESEKEIYIFTSSLISNCIYCKPIKSFRINAKLLMESKIYKTYTEEDLPESLARRALEVLAHSAGITIYDPIFPYKLRKINGNLLDLKRIRASKCKICERIHEHENPFIIIKNDNDVWYGCRRANNKTLFVGQLFNEEEYEKSLKSPEGTEGTFGTEGTEDLKETEVVPEVLVHKDTIIVEKLPDSEIITKSGVKRVKVRLKVGEKLDKNEYLKIFLKSKDQLPPESSYSHLKLKSVSHTKIYE